MLKQTLIITSAVFATALILSGVSVADDNHSARGHGLRNAQEAAGKHGITHGMQGRCNAASHHDITLNGCVYGPPPTTEPPPVPPPTTEPPPVPPPTTEPPPPPTAF